MTVQTIEVKLSESKGEKPLAEELQFGRVFTDHMFIADYCEEKGWTDHRVVPYEPLTLDPAAIVFHYGQTVFEGLKAYLSKEGKIRLFRPEQNMRRMNQSCERLCMPQIDEEFALEALKQLLIVDKDWIPKAEGTSLYIRPFMIATEPYLGVAPSTKYRFMIILSPVGSYYKEGIHPVKILVENEYVRAVDGGTGTAKTAGNYAASLKAQEVADQKGYSQVLWLDGVEKKYIEEVGSMNVFFKINGEVITPELNGSILEGITRKSIIQLLKHWNIPVIERKISMEELKEAHANGALEEAFGTGTAAVISPIGEFNWQDEKFVVNEGKTGELSKQLYDTLTGIQTGTVEDPFNWGVEVN
ncbi:branched-chain amino acid aminotransferase [Sporosarcina pasteurii]|uniref:Branched-chain-amino-acid aminotransferase n=1 Tax=Sporosarcina pasteurii TaxID=1474 RepID=A0A380BJ04_SPOPA|nr:branched-chain amino acid aminotransferase [Sporosarcina pasteurii]MDS9470768.1 branched-chain amino acid aminotransferase [Sporosarcina pasteurii]QBQ05561.1 branched-chain amino acid aminotransferase [Sporosarcina pasteurii]SUJ02231.1 Branched-chain-amino-acid aminotransferase 2 [Sporosarcina pasteurii]